MSAFFHHYPSHHYSSHHYYPLINSFPKLHHYHHATPSSSFLNIPPFHTLLCLHFISTPSYLLFRRLRYHIIMPFQFPFIMLSSEDKKLLRSFWNERLLPFSPCLNTNTSQPSSEEKAIYGLWWALVSALSVFSLFSLSRFSSLSRRPQFPLSRCLVIPLSCYPVFPPP